MSPNPDGPSSAAGARSYAHSISHSSPTASTGIPSAPHSARPASYTSTPHSAHSQSAFATQGASPNPGALANSGAAAGQSAAGAPNTLPSINSPYVRSPTFSGVQSATMPPIKAPMQQMAHAVSSPLHGQTASAMAPSSAAHDMAAPAPASAPAYSAGGHTPVPRLSQLNSLTSPGMRAAPPQMQSPHAHNTSSVPPLKQLQSPRVHRTASAQSTPGIPSIAQPMPRPVAHVSTAPSVTAPAAVSGTAFANGPRAPGARPIMPAAPAGALSQPSQAATATAAPTLVLVQNGAPAAGSTVAAVGAAATVSAGPPHPVAADSAVRPLNVSDALYYLDLVKSQFNDRPEVYNQFLEIMKEFKSHAIDTPGVIERVSRLFYGSPSLIQGFNTFLPPGYRIDVSDDPSEGVRVTTPSGSIIPDMHRRSGSAALLHTQAQPQAQSPNVPLQAAPKGHPQQYAPRDQFGARRAGSSSTSLNAGAAQGHAIQAMSPAPSSGGVQPVPAASASASSAVAQQAAGGPAPMNGQGTGYQTMGTTPAHMDVRSPAAMGSPGIASAQRPRQVPMEFNHAINYVNKIKMRFAAEPDRYKEFLEILQTYQKESRPIQEVYAQVQILFLEAPDLLDEFKQFLPDTSEPASGNTVGSPSMAYGRPAGAVPPGLQLPAGASSQLSMPPADALVAGGRLPPVGNFTPVGATSHPSDPFASTPVSTNSAGGATPGAANATAAGGVAIAQTAGGSSTAYDTSKAMGATPTSGRKRKGGIAAAGQVPAASGSSKRRNKAAKADAVMANGVLADQSLQMQHQHQHQQTAAAGYGQHILSAAAMQQAANPATASPDELAFFERVKRFIGQSGTYNEFLKLLNLYNQQVLDPKTLVERAESFIGDDQELFGWFKQFVGFDEQQQSMEDSRSGDEAIVESILGAEPGPYMGPDEAAKMLRPARPKVQLANCKAYGPSYRLLPDSSAQSKCSGRDSMCYEVLNDRWASHPTWASEDTEFVHHKKNMYEEAMFRSEEDRHEMDIEIDTNLSVIRQLTPIAQQIEQMDPEKQAQLTLAENFWGMSEALPRRALRKVYDSSRALEIIKAMHTHPATAIPIVLRRLKQKDEEWRRQRREFAKVWREIDAKNYYRALDHQGLTFKSADRKTISPKHLITEIETRRREQQNQTDDAGSGNTNTARAQSRKVASALRHRYQLEYQFSEPTVVFDVINAILAHVGRNNSQFAPSEKEMMEKFFHELFGGLFGLENPAAVSSPTEGEAVADVEIEAEAETKLEALTESDAGSAIVAVASAPVSDATADSHVVPEAEFNGAAAAASPAAVNGGVSPAGEKAQDDAVTGGQDKSGANVMEVDQDPSLAAASISAVKAQQNGDDAVSKPSTPGLISSRSWIQIGSSKRDASAAPAAGLPSKSVSRAFYTNSSYYVFLRLFQILYERFSKLRELGPECQGKVQQAQQAQSVATKLGMRAQSEVLKGYDLENTDFYAIFLELVDQFLQGQLDTNSFDEGMRVLYGTHAYRILTVDKVVQAVSKNIQHLISDGRCVDILELFTTLPSVHELSPLRSHIAYRMKVEALVGADEHVFRVGYIYSPQTMAIQLLRREDITLDEAVTEEERWAYYVDSY
ncbi:hypothetical protein LPJ66_006720, partial [Kickxella alabastrina]